MDKIEMLFRQSDFSAENEGLEKRVWNRLTGHNKEAFLMPVNKNELTQEMIATAMHCQTAEELVELAKTNGYTITKEEAESYLDELSDIELDETMLKKVAGGVCWTNCPDADSCGHHYCGMAGWENFKGC